MDELFLLSCTFEFLRILNFDNPFDLLLKNHEEYLKIETGIITLNENGGKNPPSTIK